MSILSEKKSRKERRADVVDPAVKYVRAQRVKAGLLPSVPEEKSESNNVDLPTTTNFTEFYSMSTFTKQVASEKWSEEMARKLVAWADNEDSLTLGEFYAHIGILNSDFTDLAAKYPILGKALDYTRMLLGVRREKGMITRKYDAGSVAHMMPYYDPAWREIVAWRASLKQPEGNSNQPRLQYVVIPNIPNSDLVKPKLGEADDEGHACQDRFNPGQVAKTGQGK
jgi:hypothetical protein